MAKFDVDTSAKLFIAKAGITAFDVQIDLYSDAKEHWIAGGAPMGFQFPVRTVAGDSRPDGSIIEPFYFLGDGWRIRPQETSHTLRINGNIELDQGEVGDLVVPTLGGFTVLVLATTTNRGTLLSGSTDWSTSEKEQIRHRLGLDGTTQAPSTLPSLVDEVLKRAVSGVEASAAKASVAGLILKLMSRTRMTPGELEIYRSDGVTLFGTQDRTIDVNMKPTTELGATI